MPRETGVLMETERMHIRPAGQGDLAAVAGILEFYVMHSVATFEEDPPGAPQWHERLGKLAERGLPFLVAEADGAVAGYAYASPWRPKPAYRHTVEDSVYLAPGQRGRGLGRRLLESLLAGCADAGVRQVIAVIAGSGDPASVALHRACGFADVGRLTQVGYKHGRWIDTLLMQRGLEPGRPS